MSYESPPIIRPIPRRPFDLNLTSATPPSDSDRSTPSGRPSSPNHLEAKSSNGYSLTPNGGSDNPNINRSRSILNLTSSTLFGIYSPSFTERSADNEINTPFGTGAMTPLSPDATRQPVRARSAQRAPVTPLHLRIIGIAARSTLLFLLGTAYGLLVTHLHNEQRLAPFAAQGFIQPSYDKRYMIFWGVAGVAMGSALPWFDGMWEEYFGEEASGSGVKVIDGPSNDEGGLAAQWTPVVRSIGAFFGIAFAIRKLAWTSTLQVSLTLALVNPFLWYLLDRTKPGFVLSTAVGLIGTTGLLMLDSSMVPSPLAVPSSFNSTTGSPNTGLFPEGDKSELFEISVWVTSVLFCSVLCFGHIGRRLALLRRRSRAPVLQNN